MPRFTLAGATAKMMYCRDCRALISANLSCEQKRHSGLTPLRVYPRMVLSF